MDNCQSTSIREILRIHFPLFLSSALIVTELVFCSIALGYFSDSALHRATMIGIVLPLAFFYESPIYEMVSASNALTRKSSDYFQLRRYFFLLTSILTVIGAGLFLTPIREVILTTVFKAPAELISISEPAFKYVISWIWFVGYRRLGQGVLIRGGKSKLISYFSFIRLLVIVALLYCFNRLQTFDGTISCCIALTFGVFVEAILVHAFIPSSLSFIDSKEEKSELLSLKDINKFYFPMIFSALIYHCSLPLAAWAMFRLPHSMDSLAAWGSISGIFWILGAIAVSFVSVAILFVSQGRADKTLKLYSLLLVLTVAFLSLSLGLIPPVSYFVFEYLLKLQDDQLRFAKNAFVVGAFWPCIRVLFSIPYAKLISVHRTRQTFFAILINITTLAVGLYGGVHFKLQFVGLYYYLTILTFSSLLNFLWLWVQTRKI